MRCVSPPNHHLLFSFPSLKFKYILFCYILSYLRIFLASDSAIDRIINVWADLIYFVWKRVDITLAGTYLCIIIILSSHNLAASFPIFCYHDTWMFQYLESPNFSTCHRGGRQSMASTSSSNRTKTSWTTPDWMFLVRRLAASSWPASRKIPCTVFEWSATILKARAISATPPLKRPWVSNDLDHPEIIWEHHLGAIFSRWGHW